MPRITKAKPAQDTISIQDAISQLKTTEQALRLALIDIRPDDFDTVKALPLLDVEAVAQKIEATKQPQLQANPQNIETPTQQEVEPTTEQPQNALSRPQQQQQLTAPTQSSMPNGQLTLIEQLTKQSSEEIAAVDAIAQVKNTLILNNLAVRDAELVEGINQRWQYQKQEYLGAIRDLATLGKEPVQSTPDETNLAQEIDSIIDELGKKLIA